LSLRRSARLTFNKDLTESSADNYRIYTTDAIEPWLAAFSPLHEAETYSRTRESSISPHNKCQKIERTRTSYLVQVLRRKKRWFRCNRHDKFWLAVFSTQRDKLQSREPYSLVSRTMQHVRQSSDLLRLASYSGTQTTWHVQQLRYSTKLRSS